MFTTHSIDEDFFSSSSVHQILDAIGGALLVIDLNKRIRYVNKVALELTGYEKEEILGRDIREVLFSMVNHKKCGFEDIMEKGFCEFDALLKKKNGEDFFAHVKATLFPERNSAQAIFFNFFDITEKKLLERKLLEASITDYLTGLYNRRFMEEALKREKAVADRYGITFSLILLDIDNFKLINDIYGHAKGDEVLVKVAQILKDNLRASDLCGRWGGEEFLILLRSANLSQSLNKAEKLREMIAMLKIPPIESITASFGVAEYNSPESYEETLRRADLALYRAKSQGKNCVIAF
ncbi:MAG: diguanylate cyclase [Caldimicrobium sp.]